MVAEPLLLVSEGLRTLKRDIDALRFDYPQWGLTLQARFVHREVIWDAVFKSPNSSLSSNGTNVLAPRWNGVYCV